MRLSLPSAITALCTAALLLPFLALPAAAVTIDNFEEGDFSISDPQGPPATTAEQSGLLGTNVRGGVRLVSVAAAGTAVLGQGDANLVTTPGDDGALLTTLGTPVVTTFQFIYDGNADGVLNGKNGLLNLNLTGYSSIDVTANGGATGVTVTLTLWDSNSNVPESVSLPFVSGVTSFDLAGFSLNLGDIQSLRVQLSDVDVLDALTISDITAIVPEPGTAALLALGLIGLAARARRSLS